MGRNINYILTEEQLAEVEQAINGSPYAELPQRSIAITCCIWDNPPISLPNRIVDEQHDLCLAEQTEILLSYTRFHALLSREGYRWKKTKHDLSHLQVRPAQETTAQIMEWSSHLTPSPTPNCSLWTKRQ